METEVKRVRFGYTVMRGTQAFNGGDLIVPTTEELGGQGWKFEPPPPTPEVVSTIKTPGVEDTKTTEENTGKDGKKDAKKKDLENPKVDRAIHSAPARRSLS